MYVFAGVATNAERPPPPPPRPPGVGRSCESRNAPIVCLAIGDSSAPLIVPHRELQVEGRRDAGDLQRGDERLALARGDFVIGRAVENQRGRGVLRDVRDRTEAAGRCRTSESTTAWTRLGCVGFPPSPSSVATSEVVPSSAASWPPMP